METSDAKQFVEKVLKVFEEKGLDFVRTLPAYDLQEIENQIEQLVLTAADDFGFMTCSKCGEQDIVCSDCQKEIDEEEEKGERSMSFTQIVSGIIVSALFITTAFADVPTTVSDADQKMLTIAQLQNDLAELRIELAQAKAATLKCEQAGVRSSFVERYKMGASDTLEQQPDGTVKIVRAKSKDAKPKK